MALATSTPNYRALRKRRGLSLRAVAREMGVSAPFLCDVERGFRRFSPEMADRYAAALKK